MKIVVVAGASGLVGKELVNQLLKDPEVQEIRVLVRRKTFSDNLKIQEFLVDFNKLPSFSAAFQACDTAFCCLGTTIKQAGNKEAFYQVDFTYVLEFSKQAKKAGIQTFVLNSALGARKDASIFYSRVKGEIEEKLYTLNFEHLIIVRPSLLMGNRQKRRLGEEVGKVITYILGPLFIGPIKKYKGVKASSVAATMLREAIFPQPGTKIIESDAIQ